MDWKILVATASTDQTLTRAKSALNRHTIYSSPGDHVGKASDPVLPFPKHLDCSGFVCYAIGIPRQLPPGSDKWLSTDEIWAYGAPTLPGLFPKRDGDVQTGDFLVYPDYKVNGTHHDGHIGIVVETSGGEATKVIHCSKGNDRRTGDAVQITGVEFMYLRPNYRVVTPDYDFLRRHFGIERPARLILAVADSSMPDGYRYSPVASAKLVEGSFSVDPAEIANLLGLPITSHASDSVRNVLKQMARDFTPDTTHLDDATDPRVYMFVR